VLAVLRVVMGVHFIKDVIAGIICGIICGFIGLWIL
jgi:phosphatidylglycerophosphatase B